MDFIAIAHAGVARYGLLIAVPVVVAAVLMASALAAWEAADRTLVRLRKHWIKSREIFQTFRIASQK